MEKFLFSFNAVHKAIGRIETEVSVFDSKVVMKRKISGVFSMTVKLPVETVVYFSDLSAVNFSASSGMTPGWIELSGISTAGGIVKAVNVKGTMINNVDAVNALNNPYCIVFNKDKADMEINYGRLRDVFQEYKSKNAAGGVNVINNIQEESGLDKIRKLKELLDLGAISQEEFDEKKKLLMNEI